MENTKGKIFVTAFVNLFKGFWKLTILTIYFTFKLTEIVSSFTRKLIEKIL